MKKYGEDYEKIQDELREWYKSLDKTHPAKKLSRTRWVDKYGPWRDRDISWPGGDGPRYDVIHPKTGEPCKVPERGWAFAKPEEMQRQISLGLVIFREDHNDPPIRKAHLIPIPDETSENESSNEEDDSNAGLLVMPSVIQKQAQVSVKLLRSIFSGKKAFDNPKDHEVIARLIAYVTKPGDLILDSFGGSGTTAHSVLHLNAIEGISRKFIVCEMLQDVAENITSERIRRVINGYVDSKGNKVEGLSSGFQYCRLSGQPLFTSTGQIRDDVTFSQLAEFVWFSETGVGYSGRADSPLLGEYEGRAIYLLYNGILKDKSVDGGNVLTQPIYKILPTFDGPKTIYGAACRGASWIKREQITFKQTPYALEV